MSDIEPDDHKLSDHQDLEDKIEHIAEEIVDDVEGAMEAALPPHLRLQAWARRRPVTHVFWRATILLLGLGLVVAGVAMLVLPGPGWVTIFLGLAILSSEFAWAHVLHRPLKRGFDWALERARRKGKSL